MEKYDMGKTDTGKDDRTPLMVVDLDGTLVSVNTFTLFTKWLAQHLYHDYGFIPLLGLCRDVLLRKCRLIPHSEVKRRILRIAANNCKESDFRKFAESLKSCLRPEVMTLIKDFMQEGGVVVLATAAPAVYALPFAGILGIPYCEATQYSGSSAPSTSDFEECRGDVKRMRVERLARGRNLRIECVLTDHHEDLPLLSLPNIERILVTPSSHTESVVRGEGLDYHVIGNEKI